MVSMIGALTEQRKNRLKRTGRAKNSVNRSGLKPSGPGAPGSAFSDSVSNFIGSDAERYASLIAGAAITGFGVYGLLQGNRKSSPWISAAISLAGAGLLLRGVSSMLDL